MNFNELMVAFILRASAFELLATASIIYFFHSIQDVLSLYAFASFTAH